MGGAPAGFLAALLLALGAAFCVAGLFKSRGRLAAGLGLVLAAAGGLVAAGVVRLP